MAENPIEAKHESEDTPPAEEQTEFDDDTKRAIAEVYKTEGDDAFERKDFSNAIQFYKDGINVKCNDDELNAKLKKAIAEVYKTEGDDAFERKDFSNAIQFYKDGINVNCNDDELNAKLKKAIAVVYKTEGNDACERKDFSNAIQCYKNGTNVNCNDDELNAELKKAMADAYKNEGNDAFKRKDYSKAKHLYTEGLQVNCKDDELNAKLYSNRATVHFNQGNYQDTIIDAKIAIDLQPTYIKAMEKGANACLQLRLYDEAIDWCDKGLAINKENKTLVDLRSRSVDEQNKSQRQMTGGGFSRGVGGFPGGAPGGFPGGFPGSFPGGFPGAAGGFPGGVGGFLGGAGGFPGAGLDEGLPEEVTGGETPILNDLLSDRELLAAFQDPAAMQAFQDVSQNPENLSKYGNNPNLKTIIDKLDEKFGPPGAAPPPGSGGGGGLGGMNFGNMFGGF